LQAVVAYMAQRMNKTTITKLLRIGVDEVSYRKGHRYLTVVADHDRDGAIVWTKEGRNAVTLEAFYAELGEERCARLEAVRLDMGRLRDRHHHSRCSGTTMHRSLLRRQCCQQGHPESTPLDLEPGARARPQRAASSWTATRDAPSALHAGAPWSRTGGGQW
jgi:hypothetical protein